MKEVISRELLSAVLNCRAEVDVVIDNTLWYDFDDDFCEIINIYELAHKCKEYIIDSNINNFANISSGKNVKLNHPNEFYCNISFDVHDTSYDVVSFYADTESEAIFKACQWILDNKDNQ